MKQNIVGVERNYTYMDREYTVRLTGSISIEVAVTADDLQDAQCKAEEIEDKINDCISVDCKEVHSVDGVHDVYIDGVTLQRECTFAAD